MLGGWAHTVLLAEQLVTCTTIVMLFCMPNSFLGYHTVNVPRPPVDAVDCLLFHERFLMYRRWSSRPRSIYVTFSDWEATRFHPELKFPKTRGMCKCMRIICCPIKYPFWKGQRFPSSTKTDAKLGVGISCFCCKVPFSAMARHYSRLRAEAKLGCKTLLC